MATLVLPIRELEESVRIEAVKALADTKRVATYSKGQEGLRIVFQVIGRTFVLRHRFAQLSTRQEKLIDGLLAADFTRCKPEELSDFASSINVIVQSERKMLEEISDLGSEIRVWWSGPLRKLPEQIDHLDSIAESLILASDPECLSLLALAAKQVVLPYPSK